MRIRDRIWLAALILTALSCALSALAEPLAAPQAASGGNGTVLTAGAGICTADFVVTDSSGKPVYDAKINIQIRYRALGLHRLDGTVGTNSDGKAHIEGLPEQIKKTAEFKISHGNQSKTLPYDPQADCHAHTIPSFSTKNSRSLEASDALNALRRRFRPC